MFECIGKVSSGTKTKGVLCEICSASKIRGSIVTPELGPGSSRIYDSSSQASSNKWQEVKIQIRSKIHENPTRCIATPG